MNQQNESFEGQAIQLRVDDANDNSGQRLEVGAEAIQQVKSQQA